MGTYFEGPEKKMEIFLSVPQPDIRYNIEGRWDKVVEATGSIIIRGIYTEHVDAYILSESSLFLLNNAVILITCGKTVLVDAIDELFKIIDKNNISYISYEQKCLTSSSKQPSTFEHDVVLLSEHFSGKSYQIGSENCSHINAFYGKKSAPRTESVIQIIMYDLDAGVRDIFYERNIKTAEYAAMCSGLDSIYSRHVVIDSHLFSPCGYSLNGIIGKYYYTVHVTPQAETSYASFESNMPENDYAPIIEKIISIFKPRIFSVAFTTSMKNNCLSLHSTVMNAPPGYKLTEKHRYEFECGDTVTFINSIAE